MGPWVDQPSLNVYSSLHICIRDTSLSTSSLNHLVDALFVLVSLLNFRNKFCRYVHDRRWFHLRRRLTCDTDSERSMSRATGAYIRNLAHARF